MSRENGRNEYVAWNHNEPVCFSDGEDYPAFKQRIENGMQEGETITICEYGPDSSEVLGHTTLTK